MDRVGCFEEGEGGEERKKGRRLRPYPTVDVTQFRPEDTPLLLLFDDMVGLSLSLSLEIGFDVTASR